MKLTPAEVVFETFNGPRETARILKITHPSVVRWAAAISRGKEKTTGGGTVPVKHFRVLLEEAGKRGKRLTLEDLVFGRAPPTEGVVTVKSGVKVKIVLHDTWANMTNALSGRSTCEAADKIAESFTVGL